MSTPRTRNGTVWPEGAKLTDRQKRFAEEYIVDLNQTKALERAGYAPTANHRILQHPGVQKRIAELMEERAKRCEIRADEALRELRRMSHVNVALMFNNDWSPKSRDELTEDQQRAIVGVKFKTGESGVEVEFKTAKDGKLTEVLKHLGLLNEKIEVSGSVTLEDLVPKRKPRA